MRPKRSANAGRASRRALMIRNMLLSKPAKPDGERREEDPEEAARKHEQIWAKYRRDWGPVR